MKQEVYEFLKKQAEFPKEDPINIASSFSTEELEDIIDVTCVVRNKLIEVLETNVNVIDLYTILRNYKFSMIDTTKRINLQRLYNILLDMHRNNDPFVSNVYQLILNNERYQGLKLKFPTPSEKNPDKKTTIKIYRSGKINIDGATSELEVFEIYYWIQYIFAKYWDEITFDSSKKID